MPAPATATQATAATNAGVGDDSLSGSSTRITVDGNSLASEATVNQAINSLAATALTNVPQQTVLDNSQTSAAAVLATSRNETHVKGSDVWRSALTISSNSASAFARSNLVQNTVSIQGSCGSGECQGERCEPYFYGDVAAASRSGISAARTTRQVNSGSVTAKSVATAAVLLNGSTVTNSRVAINGNTASAAAYGNVGQNSTSLEGGGAPMLVSNWQTNTGPVSA